MLILIFALSSCSTTRDNFFSRTYHQTTAKYNGYFNANESVKTGLKKIKDTHKENYQIIIPSDKVNRVEVVGQVFPNMDRAIEKTTRVITRHSMEINNKEKNKWVDDNYFLMAQARFYKKEYLASLNTFKYIIPLRIDYIFHQKNINSYNFKTIYTDISDHNMIKCNIIIN